MSPRGEYNHYNIIEIPINSGQPKLGVSLASHKIYEALAHTLKKKEVEVYHEKIDNVTITEEDQQETIVDGPVTVKNAIINGTANKRISDHIISKISSDSLTITLGGDHSLALGTVHGHAEYLDNEDCEMAVLWIDAHADINIPDASESGNLHGMPLGFLANGPNQARNPARLPGHTWIKDPRVQMHNLAYIGLRDVDDYEKDLLEKENVLAFYMADVRRLGIKEVMRQIYEKLQIGPKKKLHVSYDIDGMDPSIAPSTGTSVPGGLNLDEGLYIMKTIFERGNLELIDMVEVNPAIGDDHDAKKTVALAALLLEVAMGLKSMSKAKTEFLTKYMPTQRLAQ